MRARGIPAGEVFAEDLKDPAVRTELERTAFANAVAIRVIQHRVDHGLTQTALGRILGMKQSAVARLEAGDHEPSLTTLARLAKHLGMTFRIDVTPESMRLSA
jgi:DNA-binding XRE family transcriptional regulator